MGDRHGHSFRFDEIAVVLGNLVELEHGLCGFVEKLVDFDALLGGGFDKEGAVD